MAHQMSIVFHPGAVSGCEPPCVAQAFVAHDAVLFKVFVIGRRYFVVERPSLKNFEPAGTSSVYSWLLPSLTHACIYVAERETIFFDSHDVSKPDSVSHLSVLDEGELSDVQRPTVSTELLDRMVAMLCKTLQMTLFGIDVVVEKGTGRYAIIDINAFPGYEGVPNFFTHVTKLLTDVVADQQQPTKADTNVVEEDSGIDTGRKLVCCANIESCKPQLTSNANPGIGDSSDEKKRHQTNNNMNGSFQHQTRAKRCSTTSSSSLSSGQQPS